MCRCGRIPGMNSSDWMLQWIWCGSCHGAFAPFQTHNEKQQTCSATMPPTLSEGICRMHAAAALFPQFRRFLPADSLVLAIFYLDIVSLAQSARLPVVAQIIKQTATHHRHFLCSVFGSKLNLCMWKYINCRRSSLLIALCGPIYRCALAAVAWDNFPQKVLQIEFD